MTDVERISPPNTGNGIHSEHPLATPGESLNLPEPSPPTSLQSLRGPPQPSAVDPALAKAADHVMYSDIGVNALLNRLKQSIASAKDLAVFLRKRASVEEEHSNQLRRLSKATFDGLRSREARQGSYASQFEEVIRIHERMSDNGTQFRLNVQQMSEDLDSLSHDMERGRKQWKHDAATNESRLQDAERALDKAKQKYDSLADGYDHARTGDRVSGGKFSLRPKSAAQQEEDLQRKLTIADQDYQTKVQTAQQARQDVEKNTRPQAVQSLLQLIQECDSGVALQLQKFASFNEKLLLGNGLLISPLAEGDSPRRGLRDIIGQIDNDRDFHSYITSFTSQVPPPKEIKYEKHPSLNAPQQPKMPYASDPISSTGSFHQRQTSQSSPMGTSGPPVLPPTTSFEPLNEKPLQQPPPQPYQNDGYRGGPPGPYATANQSQSPYPSGPGASPYPSGPGASPYPSGQGAPPYQTSPGAPPGQADRTFSGPNQNQQGFQQYNSPTSGYPKPMQGQAPSVPSPLNPMAARPPGGPGPGGPGPRGPTYSQSRPVFGVHLNELFARDQSPVPIVIYQCILAVDLFGIEQEGIYRLSGNANSVAQLKAKFDNDMNSVDFRNKEAFFLDVNVPATLLKQFLRELPDPLLTRAAYREFLEAASIPDDTMRRDKLHAIINNLPDPNYATLRTLILHLHRVEQYSEKNRMSPNNLATIFAPTLMGGQMGPVQDAALQHRTIETILINALQIFDDD